MGEMTSKDVDRLIRCIISMLKCWEGNQQGAMIENRRQGRALGEGGAKGRKAFQTKDTPILRVEGTCTLKTPEKSVRLKA